MGDKARRGIQKKARRGWVRTRERKKPAGYQTTKRKRTRLDMMKRQEVGRGTGRGGCEL